MRRSMVSLVVVVGVTLASGAVAQEGSSSPTAVAGEVSLTAEGVSMYEQGRYAEARRALDGALAEDANDATAHAYLGLLLNNEDRDVDQAVMHLEEAVRLDPGSSRFHRWLGSLYGIQAQRASVFKAPGLVRKVKAELVKAVELDPSDLDARMALLQFYLGAPGIAGGSKEGAREQALAMTELDRYRGLVAQAMVAEDEGETARAEQLYRSAIAVDPNRTEAYNALGYLLLSRKRRDEAVATFRSCVEVAPDDANAHDSLAEGLLKSGRIDEAILEYRRALAIDPQFAASFLGLASCYEERASWEKAKEALARFLELVPDGRRADEARDRIAKLAKKQR